MKATQAMTAAMILRGRRVAKFGLVLSLLLSVSCVQVEPRPDFDKTRRLVEA